MLVTGDEDPPIGQRAGGDQEEKNHSNVNAGETGALKVWNGHERIQSRASNVECPKCGGAVACNGVRPHFYPLPQLELDVLPERPCRFEVRCSRICLL